MQKCRDRQAYSFIEQQVVGQRERWRERETNTERERNKHRLSERDAEVLRQTGLPVYWAAGCWKEKGGERNPPLDYQIERQTDKPTCLLSSRLLERERKVEKQTQIVRARGRDRQAYLFTEQQVVGERERWRNRNKHSLSEAEVQRQTSPPVYWAAGCWLRRDTGCRRRKVWLVQRDTPGTTEGTRPLSGRCLLWSR